MLQRQEVIDTISDFRDTVSNSMIVQIENWFRFHSNIPSNDTVDTIYNAIVTSNKLDNPWTEKREMFIRCMIYNISSDIENVIFSTVKDYESEESLSNGIMLLLVYEILLSIIVGLGKMIRDVDNIDKKYASKIIRESIHEHNERLKSSMSKMFRQKCLDKNIFSMIRRHIITLNNIFDILDLS